MSEYGDPDNAPERRRGAHELLAVPQHQARGAFAGDALHDVDEGRSRPPRRARKMVAKLEGDGAPAALLREHRGAVHHPARPRHQAGGVRREPRLRSWVKSSAWATGSREARRALLLVILTACPKSWPASMRARPCRRRRARPAQGRKTSELDTLRLRPCMARRADDAEAAITCGRRWAETYRA